MKTNRKMYLALAFLATGSIIGGCGTKRVVETEVPHEPDNAQTPAPEKKIELSRYVVKKHDTLWAIAGKPQIYGDSFEWPLIFKTNRDLITDPDLIYPQQSFKIEKDLTITAVDEAKKLAEETPKYQPHDKPRAKLPVDYF